MAKLQKQYEELNNKLKDQLLTNIEKAKAVPESSFTQKLFSQVIKTNANELVKLLFPNFDDWIGLLYNATYDGLKTVLAHSGKVALQQVEVDMEFDLKTPRAVSYLENHALEASTSYSDTMKQQIADIVTQGVENGDSIDTMTDAINQFFDDQSGWRAERIARTETINSYAQGSLEGYRQSDVVSGKSWLIGGDNESCDICIENQDTGVIGTAPLTGEGTQASLRGRPRGR